MASLLSYALCTVADVKESLGITSSDYDNLIIRKINQATRVIEAYCGRRFALTAYTNEEYNGTYTKQLVLKQRPVVSFTGLDVRDNGLNIDDWDAVDSQTFYVDNNSGTVNALFNVFGGFNRWRATYTAGYATIPEDLAEACATLAAYYYTKSSASDVGVASKKEGQREIKYSQNTVAGLKDVAGQLGIDSILDSYANYPIG